MGNTLQAMYFALPPSLQNVVVSAYGYRLKRRRYSRLASVYRSRLQRSETLSAPAMEGLVDKLFSQAVAGALKSVPFWRQWAADCALTQSDFRTISDIKKLPVISKSDILQDPHSFQAAGSGGSGLIRLNTSGTTGAPLTVVCDHDSRTHHYAFFTRLRNWFGVREGDLRATFFGRVIVDPGVSAPPFWRYDWPQRNMLFSSYHLSHENLPHYVDKLREMRPAEVIGYPSSLHQLATHLLDCGQEPLKPKVVITTAETLLPHQRDAIVKAFDCPVVNQYGCTEMAFFAAECEFGTMHVHPEHGVIEVLDDSDVPVDPGTPGRCVATGFVNTVMPLFRYDIGDRVIMGDADCSCGRVFPVLRHVEGRVDDVLELPDGRRVGRLDPVFKGIPGIVECQIAQIGPTELELRIVSSDDFGDTAERNLIDAVQARTGGLMTVRIKPVPMVPRGRGGKFRAVVREWRGE